MIDDRPDREHEDNVTAYSTHGADEFVFKEHPSLMRNWAYINKFMPVPRGLSFFNPTEMMSMAYKSNMPLVFLLCSENNCPRDIDKVRWAAEKYVYNFAFVYAFEDKLEESEALVKKLHHEPKPAIFIYEIRNRVQNVFLMREKTNEKIFGDYSENHVE